MDSKNFLYSKAVAVLGSGKFGVAVANLVAPNVGSVLRYKRRSAAVCSVRGSRSVADQLLADNVVVTDDLVSVLRVCSVIFIVVPAANFRLLMQQIAPNLTLAHILIHGTKGVDLLRNKEGGSFTRSHLSTMSEVIIQETVVRHIGCLAGPNLSRDLIAKQPTITVVASGSEKVLSIGKQLLASNWFRVYTSSDLLSVEICSVLKNIFAIGAGLLNGGGYGTNSYAFFLTLALAEMAYIMNTIGVSASALLGPAGIGDLLATCSSNASRNYMIGYRLAQGEKLVDVLAEAKEVAEGVQTVKTIYQLMRSYDSCWPITAIIYRILFEELPLKEGIACLMRYPIKGASTM